MTKWTYPRRTYSVAVRVRRCKIPYLSARPQIRYGWHAWVPALPGVETFALTKADAMKNIREACVGALKSYLDHGEEIPWRKVRERVGDKRIRVEV